MYPELLLVFLAVWTIIFLLLLQSSRTTRRALQAVLTNSAKN